MIGLNPFPDEHLLGFIFRYADHRRLASGYGLAFQVGFKRRLTNRPDIESIGRLADITGVPAAALQRMTYGTPELTWAHVHGVKLPSAMCQMAGGIERKVCPICLDEAPYHRIAWGLPFISTCPTHAVRLASTCLKCGKSLRWQGRGVTNCTCGQALHQLGAEKVPDGDTLGTKAAFGLLGDNRFFDEADKVRALAPLQDLSDGERLDFIWRIGLDLHGQRPIAFSVANPGNALVNAHLVLNAGIAAAADWPGAFLDLLKVTPHRMPPAVGRWLRDRVEPGHGGEIRKALDGFKSGLRNPK